MPAFGNSFQVDDRVSFDFGEGTTGTGTILGKSMEHIIDFYIVLLDAPISGQKAAVIPNTALTKLATPPVRLQVDF